MATIEAYETKQGRRYRVRYRTPEGRQTDKRGFLTKTVAKDFATRVESDMLGGTYVSPAGGKFTIGELGPEWLARQTAHMKPSSLRSLESAWRVQVEPKWGATPIANIRYSAVQAWIAELSVDRKSTIVTTAHSVLARILDDAVRDRLLPSNPARGVKMPRKTPRRNIYLTNDQVHELAVEAGRYRSLVLLLAYTGLRWGEAAGLRVSDVDFLRRRITVYENAVKVGSRTIVGTLKNHKHRTVPLPDFVAVELSRTCEGRARDDLLWPSSKGLHLGPPSSHDSWLSGAVDRCQAAATKQRGLEGDEPTTPEFPRVTAHALRHTAASLAISAGANVKAVQKMLGHASAAMTLDIYADLFDDDLNAVADKLSESVGKMWAERASRATLVAVHNA